MLFKFIEILILKSFQRGRWYEAIWHADSGIKENGHQVAYMDREKISSLFIYPKVRHVVRISCTWFKPISYLSWAAHLTLE